MDLSQIPIHQRLDALLERLDDHEWDDEEGYNDFVERRAQQAHGAAEPQPASENTGAATDELLEDGQLELARLRGSTRASRLMDVDDSDGFPSTPEMQGDPDDGDNSSGDEHAGLSAASELYGPASSPQEPSVGSHANDIVARVYNDAGLAPRDATHSRSDLDALRRRQRRTAKQGQAELERAARHHQELERSLADDVGAHTLKQRNVAAFLADLDSDEPGTARISSERSAPGERTEAAGDAAAGDLAAATAADENFGFHDNIAELPQQRLAERHLELVSSPPRMPGLRSFMSKRPSIPTGDESDSDLEIIPETKTNRLSRPIKTLLKLSGCGGAGSAAERRRAQEEQKLRRLELNQIAKRRQERTQRLKDQGLDIEEINRKLEEKRTQNAMRGSALLEQERERAKSLRAQEYEGDSDSEEEFSEPDTIARPKKLLSDSEDEADESGATGATAQSTLTLTKTLQDASESMDTDEEVDEREIGRTGTQYVPQLDQSALAQIMQTLIDHDGDNEDNGKGPNGSTLERDGTSNDAAKDEAHDDVCREASREMSEASSLDDNLSIVGQENKVGLAVQPNLADLQTNNLSSSQHLAEVRNRYLQAQQEQRRQEALRAREKKAEKPKFRSMFVEDQAEESEDEENGLGQVRTRFSQEDENEDDDDANDHDADLQDLVDHGSISVKEAELRRKFLEEEKLEDQRLLNKMVDGVHGGFRRRRGGQDQFIDDDDDNSMSIEADQHILEYLRDIETKRKSNLLSNNAKVEKLARDNRAAAFFSSISEDLVSRPVNHRKSSVQESLQFLRSVAEKEAKSFDAPALREPPCEVAKDGPQVTLPKFDMAVRQRSTIHVSNYPVRKTSTYASRISASDYGNAKTVEILQSLGRPSESKKRPAKRFVAPKKPDTKRARRLLSVATGSTAKRDDALFRRHWS